MSFTYSVSGTDTIIKAIMEKTKTMPKSVHDELLLGVLEIHGTAVKSIATHKGSRSETRYKPTREVTVSPPGSPPNSDTGRLMQSITYTTKEGPKGLEAQVGTNLQYGAHLEFGTLNMEPRPWLYPAYSKHKDRIMQRVVRALKDAAK